MNTRNLAVAIVLLVTPAVGACDGRNENVEGQMATPDRPEKIIKFKIAECSATRLQVQLLEVFQRHGLSAVVHRPYHPEDPQNLVMVMGRTGETDVLTSNMSNRDTLEVAFYTDPSDPLIDSLSHRIADEIDCLQLDN